MTNPSFASTPIIQICEQDAVDQFESEVLKILDAMDVGQALVTDESQVSDFQLFLPTWADAKDLVDSAAENQKILDSLEVLMKRKVAPGELLWKMAKELSEADQTAKDMARPN